MQIKATVKHYYTPTTMANIKKADNASVGKEEEQLLLLCIHSWEKSRSKGIKSLAGLSFILSLFHEYCSQSTG